MANASALCCDLSSFSHVNEWTVVYLLVNRMYKIVYLKKFKIKNTTCNNTGLEIMLN